jgi:hypothetical protein
MTVNIGQNTINTTAIWLFNQTTSTWNYVVNSSGITYLNGIQTASIPYIPISLVSSILTIGNNYNSTLDELRVWNRSLSANEIAILYNVSLTKYKNNQWNFYTNSTNGTLSVTNTTTTTVYSQYINANSTLTNTGRISYNSSGFYFNDSINVKDKVYLTSAGIQIGNQSMIGNQGDFGISKNSPSFFLNDATVAFRFIGANGTNYLQSGTQFSCGSSADIYFTDMYSAHTWLTIKNTTGYIGIATTNPQATLEVNGSVFVDKPNEGYYLGSAKNWHIMDDSNTNIVINREVGTGNLSIPNGNVGIGNSNPNVTLDVSGSIKSFNMIVNGTLNVTNSIYTNNSQGFTGSGVTSCVITKINNGIIISAVCT